MIARETGGLNMEAIVAIRRVAEDWIRGEVAMEPGLIRQPKIVAALVVIDVAARYGDRIGF
jgi:hypothetical protein